MARSAWSRQVYLSPLVNARQRWPHRPESVAGPIAGRKAKGKRTKREKRVRSREMMIAGWANGQPVMVPVPSPAKLSPGEREIAQRAKAARKAERLRVLEIVRIRGFGD